MHKQIHPVTLKQQAVMKGDAHGKGHLAGNRGQPLGVEHLSPTPAITEFYQ